MTAAGDNGATASDAADPGAAWVTFVDELRTAGERVGRLVADLDPAEQADGYRALLRAVNNQLGRFEVDRERPELVPFNGWREKLLMDNPDFRYWVADIRDDLRYRIVGTMGDAVYLSITAYAAAGLADAAASARIDSDALTVTEDGTFEVVLSRERPTGEAAWMALPEGAKSVWVRQFHGDAAHDRLGTCHIDPIDDPPTPAPIDPPRFAGHLRRAGAASAQVPRIVRAATADDLAAPNAVRHWQEMTGGAAFTEPGIHYLRGSWDLDDDEALVISGDLVPCRFWNVLLYSRFLNSLDHRHRTVSRTGSTSTVVDGRYQFVLAAQDPSGHGAGMGDWLDTEGRRFGIFVFRFLHAEHPPQLPAVERVRLTDVPPAP
jgi:hypothetical protein